MDCKAQELVTQTHSHTTACGQTMATSLVTALVSHAAYTGIQPLSEGNARDQLHSPDSARMHASTPLVAPAAALVLC